MPGPERIIISRTDSIGDVLLTLPLCGILKQKFPGVRIIFLGRSYTADVIRCCRHVDAFLDWDEIRKQTPQQQINHLRACQADTIVHVFPRKEVVWAAKRAGIPSRIATAGRLHTLMKCNHLVFFSRKKSDLHEAQLNTKLLKPLGIGSEYSPDELQAFSGFEAPHIRDVLPPRNGKFRVLLHPLSQGSAVEWGLERFRSLTVNLDSERFEIRIGGSSGEAAALSTIKWPPHAQLIAGQFSLEQYIKLIAECDAIVAASTGPLHIGAMLGLHAVGLFSPKKPIHAGRWSPIGKHVHLFESKEHPKQKTDGLDISPEAVATLLKGLAEG
ncbi:MAG: glycosyltransferase family 9 protein [Flavobacteriales bacterium]|nr:glycosyltransferase family 9 protein [Flavobacteriales bacterium]